MLTLKWMYEYSVNVEKESRSLSGYDKNAKIMTKAVADSLEDSVKLDIQMNKDLLEMGGDLLDSLQLQEKFLAFLF